MPTILIVEDKSDDYLLLQDLLREACPGYTILPDESSATPTFDDWSSVTAFIDRITDSDVILCLDLALQESDYQDVVRGVEKANVIRLRRPGWTRVAYTRWGVRARLVADYDMNFHGMIEKAEIDPLNRDQRIDYVRRAISRAVAKRPAMLFPQGAVRIVDSLGMRLFNAAFGDSGLPEIVANEASGWPTVTVRALTSGHSGAFMLLLSAEDAGRKAIILKVVKSDAVIKDEIEAQTRFLNELGPLNGVLASLDPQKVPLTGSGVYYRQAHVDGRSLLDAALAEPDSTLHVRAIVDLCLQVYKLDLATCDLWTAAQAFRLTPIDVGRFETSAAFLRQLSARLESEGYWPSSIPAPGIIFSRLEALVKDWNTWSVLKSELRVIVQHGDLNPGNVMLRKDGRIVLIDLSRLGKWPVGYDLSRLSLMLRLRVLDVAEASEHFPDRLSSWLEEAVADVDNGPRSNPVCPAASYCDDQYRRFLADTPSVDQEGLSLAYMLGSLWDLLKVISYQDISVFKRLWAAIECWRIDQRIQTRQPTAGPKQ